MAPSSDSMPLLPTSTSLSSSSSPKSRRRNIILAFCLRLGDHLCKRNVVLAILFSWLLLFYIFSVGNEQTMFLERSQEVLQLGKENLDGAVQQMERYKKDSSRDSWIHPAPYWSHQSQLNAAAVTSVTTTTTTVLPVDDIDNTINVDSIKVVDNNNVDSVNPVTRVPLSDSTNLKSILFFTPYFHMADFQFGFGREPFLRNNCPVNNCFTTNNRSLLASLEDYDAMVFHIRDMENGRIAVPNQKRRRPDQRYVMFLMESPLNDGFPYENFGNFFNWTMTYRWDSDFVRPYAWVQPNSMTSNRAPSSDRPHDLSYPRGNASAIRAIEDDIQKVKNQMGPNRIAWMVSNCGTHSERENFVEQLQNFMTVDIYGGCGKFQCSKSDEGSCMTMLESKYKFYLSFENSFCDDYVTEKFFRALNYKMIPIVLGGGDYSKMAPDHSYIDGRNFKSIAHLAEYIKYLDGNATAYAEYFEWKAHFRVVADYTNVFCQLCEALNNPLAPSKTYPDMYRWWRSQAHCIKKGRFPWSKTLLESYVDFFKNSASKVFSMIKPANL